MRHKPAEMTKDRISGQKKVQALAIGLLAIFVMALFAALMLALLYSGASSIGGSIKRFTHPSEYWGERVSDAEQSLKSSMRDYDACMSNLDKKRSLSNLFVDKIISEGRPPEQSRKIVQDDIANDEIMCLAKERKMKDEYEYLKYALSKQSSVEN